MTQATRDDLLKRAYSIVSGLRQWVLLEQHDEWLREYEAAMEEHPFPLAVSTMSAGAPSPATQQGPTDTEIVDYFQSHIDRAKQAANGGYVTVTLEVRDNQTIRESVRSAMEGDRGVANPRIRTDHKFTLHHTYSGPGCAMCGRPESEHGVANKEAGAGSEKQEPGK